MRQKIEKLKKYITGLGSTVIAFSGGVDSSLLARVAYLVLKDSAVAATVTSELVTSQEVEHSRQIAKLIGIKQYLISLNMLKIAQVKNNHPDRCYWCKKEIFSHIDSLKEKLAFNTVIEGSNADDVNSYRPGIKAIKQMKILSPLAELGFSKSDVRNSAQLLGLPNYDLPSTACLASRFAYRQLITSHQLQQIAAAEQFIKDMGFEVVRVRYHHPVARIELERERLDQLFSSKAWHQIYDYLTHLGFDYVTVDLGGFKSGSMDKNL